MATKKNYEIPKGIFLIIVATILIIVAFITPEAKVCPTSWGIAMFSGTAVSLVLLGVGIIIMMVGFIIIRMEYMRRDGYVFVIK